MKITVSKLTKLPTSPANPEEHEVWARVVRDQSLRQNEEEQMLELELMALNSGMNTESAMWLATHYAYMDTIRLAKRLAEERRLKPWVG